MFSGPPRRPSIVGIFNQSAAFFRRFWCPGQLTRLVQVSLPALSCRGQVLLARTFAGIESQEVAMTSVDRLGFHVRLKTQDGTRGARIVFLREVSSPVEARKVLVEMVGQARQT
jgi:hypothetical protein